MDYDWIDKWKFDCYLLFVPLIRSSQCFALSKTFLSLHFSYILAHLVHKKRIVHKSAWQDKYNKLITFTKHDTLHTDKLVPWFNWISLCFIVFHWISLDLCVGCIGFIGFHYVSSDFIVSFDFIGFIAFHWFHCFSLVSCGSFGFVGLPLSSPLNLFNCF